MKPRPEDSGKVRRVTVRPISPHVEAVVVCREHWREAPGCSIGPVACGLFAGWSDVTADCCTWLFGFCYCGMSNAFFSRFPGERRWRLGSGSQAFGFTSLNAATCVFRFAEGMIWLLPVQDLCSCCLGQIDDRASRPTASDAGDRCCCS
jgi:hypothetical protein